MSERNDELTVGKRVAGFLERNKLFVVIVLCAAIFLLIGFVCAGTIIAKSSVKNLTAIDTLTYELTNGSAALEEEALNAKRAETLEKLTAYTKKSGIVGVRANMLAAELSYETKDLENSVAYWEAAAKKAKNTYVAPLAYYNLGSAYEQLNKLDEAAQNYKAASEDVEFILRNHAEFSYARVLEAQVKTTEAIDAYHNLYANYPDDSWGKVAK